MSALACVFGNPIAQSKSPIIHQHFAQQIGIDLHYTKCCPELPKFESELDAFFAEPGSIGANVTSPFKERALAWAGDLTKQAERAGAVNTLIKHKNGIRGANTDGLGIVADLLFNGIDVKHKSILIIGAGGAAKGVLPAIVDAGATSISIYNRTNARAKELIRQASTYVDTNVCKVSHFSQDAVNFDLIINATTLSLDNKIPDLPEDIYRHASLAYDMVYLDEPTAFMQLAKKAGSLKVIDGLGMLLEQAAFSFEYWFGEKPDTSELRKHLRKQAP